MKMKFIAKKENVGRRLDKLIAGYWPQYSRAYIQKQVKGGAVLVNGQIKKSSYLLKENDEIEANILPLPEISLEPDQTIELKIIYEDDDVIVIDKPAGLIVHPSATQKSGTLVNGLLAHYPLLKGVGEDPVRPGIVHRLDKDTSGLMIVSKNNESFGFLKDQFKNKKVEKKYLVLVAGRPKESSGKIKTFISRSKSDPTRQKISQHGAKEAITFYKTIREFRNFTLIEAVPKTGRMHQIRVQLAWLGNPVTCDNKYGLKKRACPEGLTRQFLHAAKLTVVLPDGQKKSFISHLPPDLDIILASLAR
ncbi:MAG: hypothetical protein A2Y98_00660 [Candidatus Portnoybacteria bacterium RBG_19FT_COMBO_36_7]|uniref:Pseudouridine synthase n=1 Tax=Candidatus Portnoybacteria bacterium RBG_19FT_COMBO_36_7 TaxID=1801992 RepID=A0A1G2F7D2_9BACT|nr:MAG: hypothetical protein A2Y98_00660 [Candidatus Portnoybacteria bacterium RBG_19FT_COMBO_36_7]